MPTAEAKKVVLLNRGKRHYDLPSGRVSPGEMLEVTAEEAAKLSIYRDLVDASKLPVKGAGAAEAAKLKGENAALVEANEKLKAQLADLTGGKKKKDD